MFFDIIRIWCDLKVGIFVCALFFWTCKFYHIFMVNAGEWMWMDAVIIFCIPHVSKLPFGTNLSCFIRLQTLLLLQCRLKSLKLPAAVKLVLILFDSWVAASDWIVFLLCVFFVFYCVERMVQPPSKTNLDPLLRAYALFVSSTWFFLHIWKWCPIEWCVNLEIRPFLLTFFCPNRLKVPTENARGWAVEFSFFGFIGGLKWYFASSAVERMVQPPSKTNLDPLLRAYALFVSSTWFFLHFFEMMSNWMVCESWNTTLFVNVFLSQVESPNRKCQGLSCGIQFFFVSLGVWNGILHHQLLRECFNLQVRPT